MSARSNGRASGRFAGVPEVDADQVGVDVAQHLAALRAGLRQRAVLLARDLRAGRAAVGAYW